VIRWSGRWTRRSSEATGVSRTSERLARWMMMLAAGEMARPTYTNYADLGTSDERVNLRSGEEVGRIGPGDRKTKGNQSDQESCRSRGHDRRPDLDKYRTDHRRHDLAAIFEGLLPAARSPPRWMVFSPFWTKWTAILTLSRTRGRNRTPHGPRPYSPLVCLLPRGS
jgi:hypothetical protein